MVAEGGYTWKIVLPEMGYQVVHVYGTESFRKFLRGGNLCGVEWILSNEVGKIVNLWYIWMFVSGKVDFSFRCGDGRQTSPEWQYRCLGRKRIGNLAYIMDHGDMFTTKGWGGGVG